MPKIRQQGAEERDLYQRVFLNEVNGLLPVVLEELRAQVLPTFDVASRASYAAAFDDWCERWGMGRWSWNAIAVGASTEGWVHPQANRVAPLPAEFEGLLLLSR